MDATFVTAGDVRKEYNADGSTKCFYVSRQDADPICLHDAIPEYHRAGTSVYIDSYGRPWVRCPTT